MEVLRDDLGLTTLSTGRESSEDQIVRIPGTHDADPYVGVAAWSVITRAAAVARLREHSGGPSHYRLLKGQGPDAITASRYVVQRLHKCHPRK